MILITKNEAKYLREHGRGADINISSKTHKSRAKKYYLEEKEKSLKLLEEYRKSIIKK